MEPGNPEHTATESPLMSLPDLSLTPFFRPSGVAVIGASRDPQKLGYGVLFSLKQYGYQGPVYPVNPQASEILGYQAYPEIEAVPDPLDLVVMVLPAEQVAAALEACARRGVKAVTICSGGFREAGPEGIAREEEIKQIAAATGMALLGPNCIGSIDTHTPVNATFMPLHPPQGEIAFASQSGALTAALIEWSRRVGIGFSRVVSLGNQAGVTETDAILDFLGDERSRVITNYIEGISDGPRYLEAAERTARQKALIALKAGRSSGGSKAVASHTGSLAGSESAYEAAFERAGVLRAGSLEQMIDWARALAWQPLPRGNRVAVLTNAGGLGILAVDAMEAHGMQLAPLTDATRAFLRERVLPAASIANPVDVLAGSGPTTYALCLDALLADETVDAVVVCTAPQDWFRPVSLAEVVGEVANSRLGRRKPVLTVIMGLGGAGEEEQVLQRRRVPNYGFPDRVGSTLGAMWKRSQWLARGPEDRSAPTDIDADSARMALEAGRLSAQDSWIDGEPLTALLHAYGIVSAASGLAPNLEQARALAESLGYPVVLKLVVDGLLHKSDAGGVIVNIENAAGLERAFSALLERARGRAEMAVLRGVQVQQMVRGGVELIIGALRDPVFGPMVMAGAGGTQVELLRDVAFALAPISAREAADLIERTSATKLLAGFRGAPPADRSAAVDALVRLSHLIMDHPEIAEMEINPLIVRPGAEGAVAVDTRARVE